MHQAVQTPPVVLVAQVQGSKKEEDPRHPSMKYVKPLVGDTGDEANEIVLGSKKNQERDLSHGQPCCSDT